MKANKPDNEKEIKGLPKNVNEAVDFLYNALSLKAKTNIANTSEEELINLHSSLGTYIRNTFALWSGNDSLIQSCKEILGEDEIHPDEASFVIIDELWKRLRSEHLLRRVK